MSLWSEIAAARVQWQLLTFYQKFEQVVVLILTTLIAIVVGLAVWNLALRILFRSSPDGRFDPSQHEVFQSLFGMIFTVLIALEFKRSVLIVAERKDSIVQVRTAVLLAMLAVLRKLIILDLDATGAGKILGLSAAMLALGGVYWLVRDDKNRRLDSSTGDS